MDVTQRVGGNVVAAFTANTDFAETEVDTRRTNLTRFPLFFPEKRRFFLEGSDIYQFSPGGNLARDAMPFHSRTIGLVNGREVPIIAGGKVNGRAGNTVFGGLVAHTDEEPGVVEGKATMGVARVKQTFGEQSWASLIGTAGDPLGRTGSWTGGAEYTYGTSHFKGNKNLLPQRVGYDDGARRPRRGQEVVGIQGRLPQRKVGRESLVQNTSVSSSTPRSGSCRGTAPCG